MADCIFCKIIKGEIPSAKLFDDKKVMAFLDIGPLNKGHALVVTKEHYETLLDTPDDALSALLLGAKKVARALSSAVGADGFNLIMNNKKVAGQVVPHAHLHVIPRFNGDGISFQWKAKKYKDKEMEELRGNIAKFL